MNRNQLQKVLNDYQIEKTALECQLHLLKIKERAFKSRIKLVTRKINILDDKLKKSKDEEINFSCNDFDNLDILN